jgi:hypothetical protein
MRPAFLVDLSSAQPRENQTDGWNRVTAMNADEPDDLDDDEDEDDDDFPDDDEEGGNRDDEEDDWEEDEGDNEEDDESETWQVVDFPRGNCLDWPGFPAQLGWIGSAGRASRGTFSS